MTNDRQAQGSSGTQTAALQFGGQDYPPPSAYVDKTEYWNGSSWTELNDQNTARMAGAGWGTVYTSAFWVGATPTTNASLCETWDGTNWTEITEISTGRGNPGGMGTTTNSIVFGGNTPPGTIVTNTEHWNGSSWTEVGDMGTARNNMGEVGGVDSGVIGGGYAAPASGAVANAEEWAAADFEIKTVTQS